MLINIIISPRNILKVRLLRQTNISRPIIAIFVFSMFMILCHFSVEMSEYKLLNIQINFGHNVFTLTMSSSPIAPFTLQLIHDNTFVPSDEPPKRYVPELPSPRIDSLLSIVTCAVPSTTIQCSER